MRRPTFLLVILAAGASSHCSSEGTCPSISGSWILEALCTGGDEVGKSRTITQQGCDIAVDGMSGTIDDEGRVTLYQPSRNAPCRGSLRDNRLEVSCPLNQNDCFLSACCTIRWVRDDRD